MLGKIEWFLHEQQPSEDFPYFNLSQDINYGYELMANFLYNNIEL